MELKDVEHNWEANTNCKLPLIHIGNCISHWVCAAQLKLVIGGLFTNISLHLLVQPRLKKVEDNQYWREIRRNKLVGKGEHNVNICHALGQARNTLPSINDNADRIKGSTKMNWSERYGLYGLRILMNVLCL